MVLFLSQIKCIGFDLYSTLINTDNHNWIKRIKSTVPIIQKLGYTGSFTKYFNLWNSIYSKWREYRDTKHIEMKSNIWWEEILEKLNIQFTTNDIEKIINTSHQIWQTQISLYPEVKELLLNLKKKYKIVCISNISEGYLAREDMKLLDIYLLFDFVLTSSDLGIRKPSPIIFEHALNKLGIKKNEMIFIGDDLVSDIQGAKAAGLLMAIHIKRHHSYKKQDSYLEPDHTIYNLQEIRNFL